MVRKTKLGWLAAATLLIAGTAPGCAAVIMRDGIGCTHAANPTPYAGTGVDLLLCCSLVLTPFAAVDLPFSFLADTGFVLVDAARAIGKTFEGTSLPTPEPTGAGEHRECPKAPVTTASREG